MLRCLAKSQLFPPENPIWCKEKNEKPFFEMKCCNESFCNKNIVLNLPVQGETLFNSKTKSKYYRN